MLPEEPDLYGWVDLDHWQRWRDALAEYQNEQGRLPDRNWRALFRLATVTPNLWRHVRSHIWYRDGTVHPGVEDGGHLSHGERLVLAVALNLFWERGVINLADLAHTLGLSWWSVVMVALDEFRGGH